MLLNRAQRVVQRWIETRPGAWDGVSSAQVGMLFLLAKRDGAPIGEIAQALQVAPAAATNLSKRMEAANLVERFADADDGRLTRLRLSPDGQRARDQATKVLENLNARLSDGFSPDELATVARWLAHVVEL
ncbi:MarR family winged helix-turn-helix transcriptional regulator [Massilia sp. TWR1-2-2]|uniref:MarR family winged helix-turn-helix transcriptional regulator n=1 Tax=Massilia sp. TWR1-2-2 TaxID=2804584 RepID=UPI003CED5B19